MPESVESALNLPRHLVRLRRLAGHVWKHFQEDRCFEEAASLGFTSLLALVPLLAVIFGIVAAFPVFAQWSQQLKSFIFGNFLPSVGEQVESYLNTFLDSASNLTLPGTVFLILTALLLMFRIEVAFNRIWRVDRSRSLLNRIVMYWAGLTLGPLMIGAAIALSVQNIIAPLALENTVSSIRHTGGVFLLSWMMFTLMFVLVPNKRIPFRDALFGALLSAVLFDLAKRGFVAYVSNANYTEIYGALATIPIFLLWLYLVWIVILFGASLASSLATFADSERARIAWPARLDFQLVFRLVGHLWLVQRTGGKLSDTQLLVQEPHSSERQLQHLLHQLEHARIVSRDEEGDWWLTRDLEELKLSDLYCSGDYHLPIITREPVPVESEWDRAFATSMQEVAERGQSGMDRSLREMYRSSVQGNDLG
jgi:membrane protein